MSEDTYVESSTDESSSDGDETSDYSTSTLTYDDGAYGAHEGVDSEPWADDDTATGPHDTTEDPSVSDVDAPDTSVLEDPGYDAVLDPALDPATGSLDGADPALAGAQIIDGGDGSGLWVDPSTVVADPAAGTVIGDPSTDSAYYLTQLVPGEQTGTCAPTSAAMVLADALNMPFLSNEDVVQHALDRGLITYDPDDPRYAQFGGWSGMDIFQTQELLADYNVQSTVIEPASVEDLEEGLADGQSIIVNVDSGEIQSPEDNDVNGMQTTGHALVVAGIDPVQGMVYLNDPAAPQGMQTMIPLAQFERAWADMDNKMLVTNLPEGYADTPSPASTPGVIPPGQPGSLSPSSATTPPMPPNSSADIPSSDSALLPPPPSDSLSALPDTSDASDLGRSCCLLNMTLTCQPPEAVAQADDAFAEVGGRRTP